MLGTIGSFLKLRSCLRWLLLSFALSMDEEGEERFESVSIFKRGFIQKKCAMTSPDLFARCPLSEGSVKVSHARSSHLNAAQWTGSEAALCLRTFGECAQLSSARRDGKIPSANDLVLTSVCAHGPPAPEREQVSRFLRFSAAGQGAFQFRDFLFSGFSSFGPSFPFVALKFFNRLPSFPPPFNP